MDTHTLADSQSLRAAARETLDREPRPAGLLARMLFAIMDLVYGRRLTLTKFAALELVARVPYQAWESVAYVAMTHVYRRLPLTRRIFQYVLEARAAQDNEQWHLLIVEELLEKRGVRRSRLLARAIPQLLALFYYHVSWLLYVIAPRFSYRLNADFEEHAARTYMRFVDEHPELEDEPWISTLATEYGAFATVADLLRRIGLDEREHRDDSLARIARPRFGPRSDRVGERCPHEVSGTITAR